MWEGRWEEKAATEQARAVEPPKTKDGLEQHLGRSVDGRQQVQGPYSYVLHSYGLYSYGLCSECLYSYGRYSYCLHSHGLHGYGQYNHGLHQQVRDS